MSMLDSIPWYQRIFHINKRAKFLRILRITEWLHNGREKNRWMWIPYFFYSRKLDRLRYSCGFDIPLNVLGYGVFLAHHGSSVINGCARVGNYCCIMNNLCIADAVNTRVGDGVYFGTNVVVCKKSDIEEGVKISALSLVNKPLKVKRSLYGGVPAKLLKENIDPWYFEEPYYSSWKECERMRDRLNIL